MSSLVSYLTQVFVALLALVALAWAMIAAKKSTFASTSGHLELVARLPLEGRRTLYLVRVGSRILVLGGSEGGVNKLTEMAVEEFPLEETQVSAPGRLSDGIQRWLQRRGEKA